MFSPRFVEGKTPGDETGYKRNRPGIPEQFAGSWGPTRLVPLWLLASGGCEPPGAFGERGCEPPGAFGERGV